MPTLPAVRAPFRAIAETIVPEARSLGESEWREVEAIVEAALDKRPPAMRRQLALFVRAITLVPLARYGRRFTALDRDRRTRVLASLESAPSLLVRRGFWGLRTLIYMGYYARPAAARSIGYAATRDGWRSAQHHANT
jgi:hypothetical protein